MEGETGKNVEGSFKSDGDGAVHFRRSGLILCPLGSQCEMQRKGGVLSEFVALLSVLERFGEDQEQAKDIKRAILDDDFSTVGKIAEQNAKYMHVVMMTSNPPLYYWHPHTLRLIKLTPKTRKKGLECYFSIDAGPNVHYLCRSEDTYELQKILEKVQYIRRIICAKPANNPHVTKEHLF